MESNTDKNADAAKALISLGASDQKKPKAGDIRTADFEGADVRGRFYKKEWWLSIVDVIAALGVSPTRPSGYWTDLKRKLVEDEGFSELYAKIVKLKLPSADGKLRDAETVNLQSLLRILQSVPSSKIEPLKQWLSKVGFERLEEVEDPSKALERLIGIYLNQGRTPEWIRERIDGIMTRKELTDEWRNRGITASGQYAKLTQMLQLRSIGLGPKEHREHKGLEPHHSLRDHSTEIELLLTRLGERSTIEIARARNAEGYDENRDAVQAGGDIAKTARLKLEKLTGQPVASQHNSLPKAAGTIEPRVASTPSNSG